MHVLIFLWIAVAAAADFETNAVRVIDPPAWLTRPRVERITDHIQTELEWSIRRTPVRWYTDQAAFERAHQLGPHAMAVTLAKDASVHLGPHVTAENFDRVFAHELVHVALRQKYKDAVPKWLEEGLANHLARGPRVDYAWLARQPVPADVRTLTHPYVEANADRIKYHYVASEALIELIAKRCDLTNLLRLSVGRGMDGYLDTYCEIKDLNAAFRDWIKRPH